MDFVFLGAGRLATNMAVALLGAGQTVKAVYSRTPEAARKLAERVGATASTDIRQLPAEADAFIIAVKDEAIATVAAQLAEGRAGQTVLHTSGSVGIDALNAMPRRGVLYPLQTFSMDRLVDFARVHFYIEGADEPTELLARRVASLLSSYVHRCTSAQRRYLHLAAVFACNFANHCYALADDVLRQQGLSLEPLLPMIAETAEKAALMPPRQGQTGPAVRRDQVIIDNHLRLLDGLPMAQQVYDLMSQSIQYLSEKKQ